MPDETIGPEGPPERPEPPRDPGAAEPSPPPGAPGAPPQGAAPGGHYPPGSHYPPGGFPPPPGGYPDQLPRRITRRMDGRMLAGVSSGLGAYFNVDPVVFRVAFVALTIAGGVGVFIYLLCWALFPPAYGPNPTPAVGAGGGGQQAQALLQGALREGGWKTFLAIGAILLAVVLLFSPFTRPSVVFALVLIALGALLLIRDQPGDVRQPGPGGPPPPGGGSAPTGGFPTGQPGAQGPWQGSVSAPPPAAAPEPAAGGGRVAAPPGPYG